MDALQTAIEMFPTETAFAASLGKRQSVIGMWKKRGRVPAEYCPVIERITGRRVTCEHLRPDVDWAYLRETVEAKA